MPHGPENTSPGQAGTHSLPFRAAIFLTLFLLRFVSVAEPTDNTIHFKSVHRSLIIVSVRVNGMGPYPFLLDTGATSSAVDPQLSVELALPLTRSVRLASWTETSDVRRVAVESLSLGPVTSGPLNVLVQPMLALKSCDPGLRGVLGQDVLRHTNYLIDNHRHLIQFDNDGILLSQLSGEHVNIDPVVTRTGNLVLPLMSVPVQTTMNAQPLHLLLDSGADMVVLQPPAVRPASAQKGTKLMADRTDRITSAATFRTRLSVGSESFNAEALVENAGLTQLVTDGLLPTGSFNQLYIDNRESFVIFEPRHETHKAPRNTFEQALTGLSTPSRSLDVPDTINLRAQKP